MRPYIDGEWWNVAPTPDLGAINSDKQEPVDFAIWQARDGSWQIWSCIRHTECGGKTRLLYRWEGADIEQPDWKPMGVAMEADTQLGEEAGGLQAPHVIFDNDRFIMFYGDWNRICMAVSDDGKTFERVLNDNGQPDLFAGPYENTRDPMVLKVDDTYYCYYCGHKKDAEPQAAIFCRTSQDMFSWSEPKIVSTGGSAGKKSPWFGGDTECPFVVHRNGKFVLFRNQVYGVDALNTQYCSPDPLDFGVDDDRYEVGTLPVAAAEIVELDGQYYIAALRPELNGIRIARLGWTE